MGAGRTERVNAIMGAASGPFATVPNNAPGPLLTIDAVRFAGRRLRAPFRLAVDCEGRSIELRCDEILRLLPSRRVVCATNWEGRAAIAKVFMQRFGARRSSFRELRGYESLRRAGIACPALLGSGVSVTGRHPVLIFERIAPCHSLSEALAASPGETGRLTLVAAAVHFLARQHSAGLLQRDPHLGNLLLRQGVFYAVDGATMICRGGHRSIEPAEALENLGLFLAQVIPALDDYVPSLLETYLRARDWRYDPRFLARLRQGVAWGRSRRLHVVEQKVFRDCTAIVRYAAKGLAICCRRAEDSPALRAILSEPDRAIAGGVSLKDGNSATAARVEIGNRSYVIKRYNLQWNRPGRAVRYLLRRSRARRSWKMAHVMEALGIATARPIALIERRVGPLKTTAYFVTEYLAGTRGEHLFRDPNQSGDQLRALAKATAALIARLHASGLSHGDLNARNLIYREGQPVLLDLDSARRHRNPVLLRRHQRRDCRRLLKNFSRSSPVYEELSRRLEDDLAPARGSNPGPTIENPSTEGRVPHAA